MTSRLFLSRICPYSRAFINKPLFRCSTTTSVTGPITDEPDTVPKRSIQKFLEPRLGVTGTWTLGLGILTTLISKEYLILHAETIVAVVDFTIIVVLYRKFGTPIANYLDAQIKEVRDLLYKERDDRVVSLEDKITAEGKTEDTLSVRHDLYELEKETNLLALQVEFLKRQETVNKEVKNRLEYQLHLERFQRRFEQDLLVDWLNKQVVSAITPEQERTTVTQCISTLKSIATPV
ncbi:ATP synthase F(0) complex subunit B1, mitochondrial [Oopsacas minuta]|uniref:ATP synthase subunit b n=1 Tax=Oopsacas minuta TaxID=111878 RepID=A0AAV7JD88_9METZ|nr:ATP synthase F(0) complex subunit B1, mitochondrial [Oopsacas minuta]